jgi:lipoprotein NlpD
MAIAFFQTDYSLKLLVVIIVLLFMSACGWSKIRWDNTSRNQHIVRTGETLFMIAWRHGEDPRDLSRWNNLGDGSLIYPDQVIWLTPFSGEHRPGNTLSAERTGRQTLPLIPIHSTLPWDWPAIGKVMVEFGERSSTGILIGGSADQPIKAAATGTVVYSGNGLIGYGELIILRHNDTYLSAYGHNASLLVRDGEIIKKGQRIATMGKGLGGKPRLHFEIRRNGKPINPRQYLPTK